MNEKNLGFWNQIKTKKYWFKIGKKIKNHYSDVYDNFKHNLIRAFAILLSLLFIFVVAFVLRQWAIDNADKGVTTVSNTGIAFGQLRNNTSAVYFLQITPIIITFFALLSTKSITLSICITFIFAGGLSNVIDRLIPDFYNNQKHIDAVVDYWQIGTSAIFNFPDVVILFGFGSYIILNFVLAKDKFKNKIKSIDADEKLDELKAQVNQLEEAKKQKENAKK